MVQTNSSAAIVDVEVGVEKPNVAKSSPVWQGVGFATISLMLGFGVVFVMTMPGCFQEAGSKASDCQHPGLPGGVMFDVLEVLIVGYLAGEFVRRLGLPPLFGMLIAGYVLKNCIPGALGGISSTLNSTLRNVALATIMLRAGMGLNVKKLRESATITLLISAVPCFLEALAVAGVAKFTFPTMNLVWALMLGFVIADVSPAVTTPIFLDFMAQRLGTNKGIPTVLLAAGSVNGVICIVMYSVLWEFAWASSVSGSKLAEIIGVKLVLQVIGIGVLLGMVAGRAAAILWTWTDKVFARFFLVFFISMMLLFGCKRIDMDGGGTLAVITFGATLQNTLPDSFSTKPVADLMANFWASCGSVFLFALLGASVDQSKLDPAIVGLASATVALGLVARSIAQYGTVSLMPDWNRQEKAFAVVAWCPKATVQAALATVALDYVKKSVSNHRHGFDEGSTFVKLMTERSEIILNTAVVSIMLTAPLFAVLMTWAGNRWLHREDEDALLEKA